jgi:hypothetical protein
VIYTPSDFDYSTLSGCNTIVDIESSDNTNKEGSGLTYSIIGGADQGKFSIDASTGVLSWSNFTPDAKSLFRNLSPSQKRLIFRHFSPFFSYVAPAMRLQKRKN